MEQMYLFWEFFFNQGHWVTSSSVCGSIQMSKPEQVRYQEGNILEMIKSLISRYVQFEKASFANLNWGSPQAVLNF